MQDWIIAMLVVSALLIARDMAKTVFGRKNTDQTRELLEHHPQKERIEKCAAAFQKLADSFYEMPYRKEALTNQEMEGMFSEVHGKVCMNCQRETWCWRQQQYNTYRKAYELLHVIEQENPDMMKQALAEFSVECIGAGRFFDELKNVFERARLDLLWSNRLIENRIAIAGQLGEMARIMTKVSEELYHIVPAKREIAEEIERASRKKHVLIKNIWQIEEEKNAQVFLTVRARSGLSVPASDLVPILGKAYGYPMKVGQDSKRVIKNEFVTILFLRDINYKVSYGAARVTKEKEKVSGDNFLCSAKDEGKFVMCLSDGMGSGIEACHESEVVVDLLEQFLDSGFSREAAAKILNSSLILQQSNGMYSTIDVCTIDLYTGLCEFLKAGASTTFIKHRNKIETITSTSLAMGLVAQVDFETTTKSVEDGDYLIMVTDGVLDALPAEKEEETMKDILVQAKKTKPKELGREILERVLGYSDYHAFDDMTVLVAGIAKK